MTTPTNTDDEVILVDVLLTEEHVTTALLGQGAWQPSCSCGTPQRSIRHRRPDAEPDLTTEPPRPHPSPPRPSPTFAADRRTDGTVLVASSPSAAATPTAPSTTST